MDEGIDEDDDPTKGMDLRGTCFHVSNKSSWCYFYTRHHHHHNTTRHGLAGVFRWQASRRPMGKAEQAKERHIKCDINTSFVVRWWQMDTAKRDTPYELLVVRY